MEKCVVFWMLHHLMGFLHLIGVLWNVDANLAGFGSAAIRPFVLAVFMSIFVRIFQCPALYRKSPVNSDSRIPRKCLFRIARTPAPLKHSINPLINQMNGDVKQRVSPASTNTISRR
ncbi:hypothetical protein [Paraburkholderia youngii]|uniref:Uncharacterized protein n=1 Tax=Paraburkholderia youngii TaxID=2782701 RepID=A0ABX2NSQ9_9BURK|nr:hypothetical protein [Paraburkholderia youngii]NVI07218.1 hypothetical protein [Paraburkholderia youngii]